MSNNPIDDAAVDRAYVRLVGRLGLSAINLTKAKVREALEAALTPLPPEPFEEEGKAAFRALQDGSPLIEFDWNNITRGARRDWCRAGKAVIECWVPTQDQLYNATHDDEFKMALREVGNGRIGPKDVLEYGLRALQKEVREIK